MKSPVVWGVVVFLLLCIGIGAFVVNDLGILGNSQQQEQVSQEGIEKSVSAATGLDRNSSEPSLFLEPRYAPNIYNAGLKTGTSFVAARAIINELGGEVLYELTLENDIVLLRLTPEQAVVLRSNPNILWVEQEQIPRPLSAGSLETSFFTPKIAHAQEVGAVRLFILDSGDHAENIRQIVEDTLLSDNTVQIEFIDLSADPAFFENLSELSIQDQITIFHAEAFRLAIERGADVINYSYVCSLDPIMTQALNLAHRNGVIVVNSAGNTPGRINECATHAAVVSVGSLTADICVDKNLGANTPEIQADFYAFPSSYTTGGYGTSYSAPRITARIADILAGPAGSYDTDSDSQLDFSEVYNKLSDDADNDTVIATGVSLFANGPNEEGEYCRQQTTPATLASKSVTEINNPTPTQNPITQGQQEIDTSLSTDGAGLGQNPSSNSTGLGLGVSNPAPANTSGNSGLLDGALVPKCESTDTYFGFVGACQLCDLAKLADNIVKFAVAFSVIIATLMFAYAGVLYFTASTSPDNIKKAHGIFFKVFAGLIIVLIAWLVIDIFIKTLSGGSIGPWHEIPCVPYKEGGPLNKPTDTETLLNQIGRLGTTTGQIVGRGCAEPCVAAQVRTSSNSCLNPQGGKGGSSCLVTTATNAKLVGMNRALGGNAMTITSAIGGCHQAHCQHSGEAGSGTCVDASFTFNMRDPENLERVFRAASQSGLRADFEVRTGDAATLRAAMQGRNMYGGKIIDVGHATGDHFSIYNGSYGVSPAVECH